MQSDGTRNRNARGASIIKIETDRVRLSVTERSRELLPVHRRYGIELPFHRHVVRVGGYAGVVLAGVLSSWLASHTRLSFRVMGAIILLSMAIFLALAMSRKIRF